MRTPRSVVALVVGALVVLLAACGSGSAPVTGSASPAASGSPSPSGGGGPAQAVLNDRAALLAAGVTILRPTVVSTTPHDTAAFTEGFEMSGTGSRTSLWEGTGLTGQSALRELDPATGAVRRSAALPSSVFGEGITILPDRIWQMTYQEHVVYERDPSTLRIRRSVPNAREGWGLTHDATRLISSDGTEQLVFRDPATFAETGSVRVTLGGQAVRDLNELEYAGGAVWANVWMTNRIVRIDPATGRVTAIVDGSSLQPATRSSSDDVLNGIAAVPGTDQFLVTGKRWATTYKVRFTPA